MNPNSMNPTSQMYMDQTALMAEEIHAEEQRVEQMYKDTYKQRKIEGRPIHTTLSYSIVGLGLFSFMIQLAAVSMTSWRGNWVGVLGYPMSRQWGLWGVKGAKGTKWYHEQSQVACEVFGSMHLGGFCISPLCLWYKIKCMVYLDMWVFCTAMGLGFVIVLLLHGACVAWTAMLTPKTIQFASIWWSCVAIGHLSLLAGFLFLTDDFYDALNIYSFYPPPFFDIAFFLSSLAALAVCTLAVLGCLLAGQWPVPDVDTDTESEDDL